MTIWLTLTILGALALLDILSGLKLLARIEGRNSRKAYFPGHKEYAETIESRAEVSALEGKDKARSEMEHMYLPERSSRFAWIQGIGGGWLLFWGLIGLLSS